MVGSWQRQWELIQRSRCLSAVDLTGHADFGTDFPVGERQCTSFSQDFEGVCPFFSGAQKQKLYV